MMIVVIAMSALHLLPFLTAFHSQITVTGAGACTCTAGLHDGVIQNYGIVIIGGAGRQLMLALAAGGGSGGSSPN